MPGVAEQQPAQAAKPASTAYASIGGSAVQLGAFSSAANARNAWSQLSSRFETELRGLTPRVVPVGSSGRQLYRLEAPVADPTAARRLCRQLAQQSQACLPVS
jgi:cell division septation protein DedD